MCNINEDTMKHCMAHGKDVLVSFLVTEKCPLCEAERVMKELEYAITDSDRDRYTADEQVALYCIKKYREKYPERGKG